MNSFEQNYALQAGEFGLIGAIASWCESLQGQTTLKSGLLAIGKALNVGAIALARAKIADGMTGRAIAVDVKVSDARPCPLEKAYCVNVMGKYLIHARPGTIWHASAVTDDPDPVLTRFQRQRGFRELTIVPLAVNDQYADILEFHFEDRPTNRQLVVLQFLVDTLVRSWSRRQPGMFLENLLDRAPHKADQMETAQFLAASNPAQLSRAEFRVCHLLRRGLATNLMLQELSITKSTLRTHMRSIFAKTQTTNQTELIYRLMAPAEGAGQINDQHFGAG